MSCSLLAIIIWASHSPPRSRTAWLLHHRWRSPGLFRTLHFRCSAAQPRRAPPMDSAIREANPPTVLSSLSLSLCADCARVNSSSFTRTSDMLAWRVLCGGLDAWIGPGQIGCGVHSHATASSWLSGWIGTQVQVSGLSGSICLVVLRGGVCWIAP